VLLPAIREKARPCKGAGFFFGRRTSNLGKINRIGDLDAHLVAFVVDISDPINARGSL
jgi:hypothetical protein